MIWEHFIYFAIAAILLWSAGAFFAWKAMYKTAMSMSAAGLLVFFSYLIIMWIALERPPMRTMGETRLWYSLFLSLTGLLIYCNSRYKWVLSFSTVMATLFILINLLRPEIHSKPLMPALQSPWFAPHVIVYIYAYAMLSASALVAAWVLIRSDRAGGRSSEGMSSPLVTIDNLVQKGVGFMTIGMLFGALWAKDAWGHYWSWDPKETWAAATWLSYLGYIHYRLYPRHSVRIALWMLIVSFLLLQMCWWGINYLPVVSNHTYTS